MFLLSLSAMVNMDVFYVCGLFDLFVRSTHENSTSNEMRKARDALQKEGKKKKMKSKGQICWFLFHWRRKMHQAITSITALISLLTSSYLKEPCRAIINIDLWYLCEHVRFCWKVMLMTMIKSTQTHTHTSLTLSTDAY